MSIRKKTDEIIITKKQLAIQNAEKAQRAAELIVANEEVAFQNAEKEKCEAELSIVNNELVVQIDEKEKRAAELIIANKELVFQNEQKEKRAAELGVANWELAFQNVQKEKRAAELIIANKELAFQNTEKEKRAAELVIANKELVFQNEEKEKRAAELNDANHELAFQNKEKEKRAAELIIANKELVFQNDEKEKRAAELIVANMELAFQNEEKENRAAELIIANKELVFQYEQKRKRAAELIVANEELAFQNEEKENRAAELIVANDELAFQNEEKENRAAELIIANKELIFQNEQKENRAAELIIANKELAFQNEEKENRAAELIVANDELAFQNEEKEKRAAELIIANKELAFQNEEKEKRAAELVIANKELVFQNEQKEKRAAELIVANKELAFQNEEKENRAAELIVANEELAFQNVEKENRAAELIIANKELVFQNEQKENRAAELIVANDELAFQNEEKEKRAAELVIANKELIFQNEEKENRATEFIVANEELAFQNEEKENRAAELIIANKELAFQNEEKEKRAAELIIANKELAFQNEEKENRAAELVVANKELVYQNEQKEKRAAELIIANEELAFQNEEKENRAAELIIANKELAFQNEEKENRAAELVVANKELVYQNEQKEKRAAELIIANEELAFQNEEKENRAAELITANKEIVYQNEEKEKRAAELVIANSELEFQNKEKENRAAELVTANKEIAHGIASGAAEKIKSDTALVESEKKYEHLFENNPLPMFIWDFYSLQIIDCNKEALLKYGYTKDEFLHLTIRDIRPVEDIPLIEEVVKLDEFHAENNIKTWRHRKKNGELMFMKIKGHLVDYNGKKAMLVMLDDITEKLKAENQKEFERRDKEALINNTDDLIWSVGTDFKLIAANSAFIKSLEDMTGNTIEPGDNLLEVDVFPEDYLIFWETCYRKVLSGKSLKNEIYFPAINNLKESWAEISFNPIYKEGNLKDRTVVGCACYSRNITETKIAEETIKLSEAHLTEAQQLAKMGSWDYDIPTDKLIWSKQLYSVFDTDNETFIETHGSFLHLVDEKDRDFALHTSRQTQKTGEPFNIEYHITTRKGERRVIQEHGYGVKDENGKVFRLFGTAQDITERKKAEEQIEESEKRYRQIVETAQEGIWLVDKNDKTTFVNDKTCEIFGYSREEIMGKDIYYFMGEEGKKLASNSMQERRNGNAGQHIVRFLSKSGKEIWTNLSANPLFNEGGDYKGSLAMITDITESRITEIRNSFKAELLNTIGQAVMATDLNGNINFWNKAAEKIYGWTSEEAIGKNIIRITPSQQTKEQAIELMQELTKGNAWSGEFLVENKNGQTFPIYITNAPTYDQDHKLSGIIGVSSDITERKFSETRLKDLNENLVKHTKELAMSNAELEQFAYVASHDLQEPLRMVTGFLSQLEKKYRNIIDARGKKYIDFAVDGAKRMRQIILDLLEYSRVGRIEDKLEDVDLNVVVEEIQWLFRKQISEKTAVFDIDKLPVVKTYNAPLRQVFQNLINNALKYTRKDHHCKIQISVTELKAHWQFAVTDNGIGIAGEYFDKIFIIFQRLHNKDEFSGTGMGLAVTKKIIENLGGWIWVESKEGKGTTFYFTIKKLI